MADQRGDANRFDAMGIDLNENWQDDANCLGVDPDLFFPERGASTREAKEVCRGCVVRGECLEFALQNGEKFGIWAGCPSANVDASAANARSPLAVRSAPDRGARSTAPIPRG
jgi:hypothetical protein